MGTDYTYAYSYRFRNTVFRDNTIDENLLIGVDPKKVPENEENKELIEGADRENAASNPNQAANDRSIDL